MGFRPVKQILIAVLILSGCGSKEEPAAPVVSAAPQKTIQASVIEAKHASVPMILFPGSAAQVSPHVEAVLFLTLLSGRNPEFLVGQQVKGTPLVRDYDIEPIPTGYILVDTGTTTSVAKHSNTAPIPESELISICDHALCAQYMGQSFVYLEAGSGAQRPISARVIESVRKEIEIPLIVGGGIKTVGACQDAVGAGADFVVVGTALEVDQSENLLRELSDAVRGVHVRA